MNKREIDWEVGLKLLFDSNRSLLSEEVARCSKECGMWCLVLKQKFRQ